MIAENRWHSLQGFTLIELLMVIAIISLLVSILMPSLSNAKELAKMTQCQSNLHNISIAIHYYETDFDRFPANAPSYGWLDTDPGVGSSLAAHTTCIPSRLICYIPPEPGTLYLVNANPMRASAVYDCPNKATDAADWDLAESYGHGTYLYNMDNGQKDGVALYGLRGRGFSDIPNAAATGLIRDFTATDYAVVGMVRYGIPHFDGQNMAYCDGHVEYSIDEDYLVYTWGNLNGILYTSVFPWPGVIRSDL